MTYLWLGLCPSIARELLEMAYVCLILFVYFYTLLATNEKTVLDRNGVWSLGALSFAWIVCWRAARVDMFS